MGAVLNSPVTASTLPPIIDSETGQVIMRDRIKNAASLASTYQALFIADFQASQARAVVQSEVDGNPPFSEAQDRLHGVAGRTNINFGYLSQSQMDVERPYNSVFDSIDTFCTMPTKHGQPQDRMVWSQIMAEELTRMIRNWPDFEFNRQMCVHLFTMYGVAFTFREDDLDWRWKVYDLQYLKLPRRTRAVISAVDLVTCKVAMLPSDLQKKIENPEAAELAGWNVKAVEAAIKTASQKSPDGSNPEEVERSFKDQDYFTGISATTVDVVHGWVAEVDGTITHLIARYDGQGEFLFESKGKFKDMSQLITAYTYGVGSNGDFYALRGNAWRGHNMSLALNLLTGKFFDQSIFVATPLIEVPSEDAVIDQMIQPKGPYNTVVSGTVFPEISHPDFQNTLIPAMDKAQSIFTMRTPARNTSTKYTGSSPKTAEEIKSENALDGALSTESIGLFFQAWGNDVKEVARRVINPALTEKHPGGKEAMEFRRRCMERGVPSEAILAVDVASIEINRGVGKGSVQERRTAFGALMQIIGRLDQEGQQIVTWQYIAAYTDVAFANKTCPLQPGLRPPVDVQIANMENPDLVSGLGAVIVPNQNHVIHVGVHLGKLGELAGLLKELQISDAEAIPQMMAVWMHSNEHMEFISPEDQMFPVYKEELEQYGEMVLNGQKHLDAQAKKAEQAAGEMPVEGGDTSAAMVAQAAAAQERLKAIKQSQDLQFSAQKHQLELAQTKQKMVNTDAEASQKIKYQAAKGALELQQKAKQAQQSKKPTNGSK